MVVCMYSFRQPDNLSLPDAFQDFGQPDRFVEGDFSQPEKTGVFPEALGFRTTGHPRHYCPSSAR
jgi:hypothetical protein